MAQRHARPAGRTPAPSPSTPSISGLTAGTYTATVTRHRRRARAARRESIPVTFVVDPPPPPPVLSISPSTLAFSADGGRPDRRDQGDQRDQHRRRDAGVHRLGERAVADRQPRRPTRAPRTVSVTPSTAGLAPGVYTGTVTIAAAGVAGSPKAVTVTFTVTRRSGLRRARRARRRLGLRRGVSGTTAADASTAANAGTISGATRTAFGRFGGALSFDGVNDLVTIPDANSLDLTTGMTLSAWVNPATATRRVAHRDAQGAHRARSATRCTATPTPRRRAAYIATPLESSTKSTSARGRRRLDAPRDDLRRLDAAHVRQRRPGLEPCRLRRDPSSAPARCASAATRSGREWFSGLIDEVRVYNRAAGRGRPAGRHGHAGHLRSARAAPALVGDAGERLAFDGDRRAARARRPRRSRSPTPAAGR